MSLVTDARRLRRLSAATGPLGFAAILAVEFCLDPVTEGTPTATPVDKEGNRMGISARPWHPCPSVHQRRG